MKKIIVGMTGASGSVYAKRLIEELLKKGIRTHVIATTTGEAVFEYELGINFRAWIAQLEQQYEHIKIEDINHLFAGVASGSNPFDAVIVAPCSMGTLAEIATGLGKNLLTRSADVALKEKRHLVIVPRETPFNTIHLENMLKLAQAGATILPAMPGFYHRPQTMEEMIDFVIGKIFNHLGIENNLFDNWED